MLAEAVFMYNENMKKNRFIFLIIIIVLLMAITSCQNNSTEISTATNTPIQSEQVLASETPQASFSEIPSNIPTVSLKPSETVKPTPSEAEKTVISTEEVLNKLDAEQVVLLVVDNENDFHATLSYYEKIEGTWTPIISEVKATVGKYGINKEKEGDLKSPTGIFSLGSAFGYGEALETSYPFLELNTNYHWVDDVNSIYYNQLVNYKEGNVKLFSSSEQLRTFDVYKYGLFINYNRENIIGEGSAIFMHIYRSEESPTGGCVAVDEENLKLLISKLDISKNPLIVIGDNDDYENLIINEIEQPTRLNDEFVYIKDVIPDIFIDARYYSENNFLARNVDGYMNNTAIIKYDAALALETVQEKLLKDNKSLIIFDAYRPQRAVDDFVAWTNDENDTTNKESFYPDLEKNVLIEYGYIASLSSHSKGNAVDLSIVDLKTGKLVDMGSNFDFFGNISHYDTTLINETQKNNRTYLRNLMIENGFSPYNNEWWHFTYNKDKYTNAVRYDFVVSY